MFKIKTTNKEFIKLLEDKYMIVSKEKSYNYIITDDSKLIESDKINILFDISKIDEVDRVLKAIVLGEDVFINVENNSGIKKVNVKDIVYFEALENDVFAILENKKYHCEDKLYVLEERLKNRNFVRSSKSFLVNIAKIDYIRPLLNYKLLLVMDNGDKIDVNRTYIKSFKKSIEL